MLTRIRSVILASCGSRIYQLFRVLVCTETASTGINDIKESRISQVAYLCYYGLYGCNLTNTLIYRLISYCNWQCLTTAVDMALNYHRVGLFIRVDHAGNRQNPPVIGQILPTWLVLTFELRALRTVYNHTHTHTNMWWRYYAIWLSPFW